MPFFRCAVCNVISPNLSAHDTHLSGKRHKRNEEAAAGLAAPVKTAREQGPKPGNVHATKRRRIQEKDAQAVSAVRIILKTCYACKFYRAFCGISGSSRKIILGSISCP